MCLVSILTSSKLLANKSIVGTGHYLSPAGVGGGGGGGGGGEGGGGWVWGWERVS